MKENMNMNIMKENMKENMNMNRSLEKCIINSPIYMAAIKGKLESLVHIEHLAVRFRLAGGMLRLRSNSHENSLGATLITKYHKELVSAVIRFRENYQLDIYQADGGEAGELLASYIVPGFSSFVDAREGREGTSI